MEKIKQLIWKEYNDDYEIIDINVIKLGCVLAEANLPKSSNEESKSNANISEPAIEKIQETIFEKVKEHSNIFKPRLIDNNNTIRSKVLDSKIELIKSGPKLLFDVKIPSSRQYLSSELLRQINIEEFSAIFTGSLFLVYAEVNDYPVYTTFGFEFRNLMQNIIDTMDEVKSVTIGPSPIHPNFYVVRVKEDKEFKSELILEKEDVIFIIPQNIKIEEFCSYFFGKANFDIGEFYGLEYIRANIMKYISELYNIIEDLSNKMREYYDSKWYKFKNTNEVINTSKKLLTMAYKRYFDYESGISVFSKEKIKYLDDIEKKRYFGNTNKYFSDMLDINYTIPTSITNSLAHYQNIISSFGDKRTIIIASILGALIGAIITMIAK